MKRLLFVLIGITLVLNVNAQSRRTQIKANELYEYGSYQQALEKYMELWDWNMNDVGFNYWVAKCYLQLNQKSEALEYITLVPDDAYKDVKYLKALSYYYSGDYTNALIYLKQCDSLQVKKLIANCVVAQQVDMDTIVQIQLLDEINTERDEYNLIWFQKRMFLWNQYDRKGFERIMTTDTSFKSSDLFNNLGEEGHVGVLGAGEDRLFIYLPYNGGDIYQTMFDGKKFSLPKKVKINLSREASSVSYSNETIYFVSDRDGGYGGMDIYCSKFENGQWSEPVNLGPKINSALNEATPFIYGDTIYFSSEYNSIGGYDIQTSIRKDGEWTKPVNLGSSINTQYDELYYKKYNDTLWYFSSDRSGNYDIYSLYRLKPNIDSIPTVDSVEIKDTIPEIVEIDTTDIVRINETKLKKIIEQLEPEFEANLKDIREKIPFDIQYTMVQAIAYDKAGPNADSADVFMDKWKINDYNIITSPRGDTLQAYLIDQKFYDYDGTALEEAALLRKQFIAKYPMFNPFIAIYGANGERRMLVFKNGRYILLKY